MHISDIKKYLACPRMYLYCKDDKPDYFPFFNINININQSIADKLNINEYLTGQVGQENEDTLKLLENKKAVFAARFVYKQLRVKTPLIVLEENGCQLYFYSLSTNLNIDYLTIDLTRRVVENCGIKVNNISCLYLNENYIRGDELDNKQLWLLTSEDDKKETSILEACKEINEDCDYYINLLDNPQITPPKRSYKCSGKNRCDYYYRCFPDEQNLPDNSILHLASSAHKYEMYENGIVYLKDADLSKIEGNKIQYAQIMADKNGGLYFEKSAVKNWLEENITFPIAFLDFEWDLYPIPPYKGMKPLDVLPFQYSLHIYDGKNMKHFQYIGVDDDRQDMIEHLLQQIPNSGSVVCYNAIGAEMIRIKEFAQYLPKYSQQLEEINQRMVDLAIPFIGGCIYDTTMAGGYSLKNIEAMVDSTNTYKQLEVGDGVSAVKTYRTMCTTVDEDSKQEYLNQLYKYCGMDTYSLYKVYNWIIEKINA